MLRHGEPVTTGVLTGHTNLALSVKGRTSLQSAVKELPHIEHCIASPLIRCFDFASDFCKQNAIPLTVEKRIMEMNFGDWDGKTYTSLWELQDNSGNSLLGQFWANPWDFAIPNGESMNAFCERIDSWWQTMLAEPTTKPTLVVTHAGVIKHLIARVLSISIKNGSHLNNMNIAYAGLIKISIYVDENGKAWPTLEL